MTARPSYSEEFIESLMRHEAPRKNGIRRKAKQPLKLTPPKCDDCGRWRSPDFDHSACPSTRR